MKAQGVVVVGINTAENSEPAKMARQFRDQHKLTYPILVDADNKVAESFGVQGYPTNVVIDPQGKIRYLEAGFDPEGIRQALAKSKAARPAAGARRPAAGARRR